MNVEGNMHARKEAEAAFSLATEVADALPDELRQRYWDVLCAYVDNAAGKVKPKEPEVLWMGDTEAKAFRRTVMPRGKYEDESVDDVQGKDPEYLDYWVTPDKFTVNLGRYLRSDLVQREQRGVGGYGR